MSEAETTFWDLAAELQAEHHDVAEGTIMGGRCVRAGGEFLGMYYAKEEAMILKLPADRVQDLIDAGDGRPFAPAGKVFKEWLAVPDLDEARWRSLMAEALEFVRAPN